jgi:hypothetical protein
MFVDSFCFEKIQHIILASVRLSFNMPHNNMFALLGLYIPFLQKVFGDIMWGREWLTSLLCFNNLYALINNTAVCFSEVGVPLMSSANR